MIKSGGRYGVRRRIGIRLLLVCVLGIVFGGVCFHRAGTTVLAEEQDFVIDAVMLPQGQETYDVRLTVENRGEDWEGIARLTIEERYSWYSTAYDTVLSLPQGSTKQFTVRIPKNESEISGGTVKVILLDEKSKKSAEKEFYRLLTDESNALSMGILSDAYSTLTYLDMGGREFYFGGDDYPIRLVELNQGNLEDSLAGLTILVIDSYDTSVLTDEEVKAIELWNYDGGVLIVGTGSYGEKTLAGLDYLEIECGNIRSGEESDNISGNVDFTQLQVAQLRDLSGRYGDMRYDTSALVSSMGDGAAGIVPYGLSELGEQDASVYQNTDQESFVMYLLVDVSGEASSRYGYSTSSGRTSGISNMLYRLLGILGNSSGTLHFGALRFIVIAYVIFAGPVLYIILRILKKRELYWAAVPVAAVFGILLVFLAGRGFEVVSTRVYSVTVEDASGKKAGKTYLHCYDADHREWELRLAENYQYAGPIRNSYYYGDMDSYVNRIKREGDRLYFGIRPSSSFEDGYFCAGRSSGTEAAGSFLLENIAVSQTGGSGTVMNDTGHDFAYFAVIQDNTMYLYKELLAGESCDLQGTAAFFDNLQSYRTEIDYAYLYDLLDDALQDVYHGKMKREEVDALAALGVGIFSVYPEVGSNETLVIGVAEDWDKTVDDTCSEKAYGCIYMVQ